MRDYIITVDESEEELMHYGVVGMKWGHRKSSGGSGSGSTTKKKSKAKKIAKIAAATAAAAAVGYGAYQYKKDPVFRSTVNYYGGIAKGAAAYDAKRAGAKIKSGASIVKGAAAYDAKRAGAKIKSGASIVKGAAAYDAKRLMDAYKIARGAHEYTRNRNSEMNSARKAARRRKAARKVGAV